MTPCNPGNLCAGPFVRTERASRTRFPDDGVSENWRVSDLEGEGYYDISRICTHNAVTFRLLLNQPKC